MRERRFAAQARNGTWQAGTQNRDLAIIWPLLGRHIAFHRRLVDLTENVKAALLLSQTIYWTRHGRDIASTGGWFLKTTEQWEMETGLSTKEQISAREVLRTLAVLSEQRIGIPAKLHYRLCVDQLGNLLSERIGRASSRLDWGDGAAVAELLGPSIAYHRRLAGIGGGAHAGLLLSRTLHLTRLQTKRRWDAWIRNSATQWAEDIGLTRRELDTARRDLAHIGVWDETLAGVPPTLIARVRLDCLLALLASETVPISQHDVLAHAPDGGIPAITPARNGESSWRESRLLVPPNPPDQIRQNRHHSSQRKMHSKPRPLRALRLCVNHPCTVIARRPILLADEATSSKLASSFVTELLPMTLMQNISRAVPCRQAGRREARKVQHL